MKKSLYLPSIAVMAFAVVAIAAHAAQEATLNTPIARASEAKYKIALFKFSVDTAQVTVDVLIQDASNNDIRTQRFTIPSLAGAPCTSATSLNGLAGAMNVTRSGETGGNARIQQFRILGYLVDQGCLTGVTLVP